MIDEERLKNYMGEVRKEMKRLGAGNGFIKNHLTQLLCIHGILDNQAPEEVALQVIGDKD